MPRLFTVRWPILARLDGVLLFPVALVLASEIAAVRYLVNHTFFPALPSFIFRWGISKEAAYWIAAVIAGFLPYLLLLVLADRLLTVRKGFTVLSLVTVAAVTAAALDFAPWLATMMPPHTRDAGFLTTGRNAAFVVCGLAVLLHLRPFWIGLVDQGEVAMRVIDRTGTFGYRSARDVRRQHERDAHYRESSGLRGFGPQEQYEGAGGVPKEGRGLKFMFGFAWVGIMAGLGFAYFHWNGWGSGGHETGASGPIPGVQTGNPSGKAVMHPTALVSLPETLSAPAMPTARVAREPAPVVTAAALPSVQRPSEVPPGLNPDFGPNEAVALRDKDGAFAFDAIVNGARVTMLFDTGASVVALRAEEASRLGLNLSNLNYSAKVKTANGTADVAPVIIDTLTIGNITQRRVVGYVAREGALPRNLLGQTFLGRLSGFNVENNRLVLKGH